MALTQSTRMVTRYLQEQFRQVWVHPRGTRAFGKLDLPTHRIAVNGWYPDMLCLTDDDRVVAVMMELENGDLMRGVGRAVAVKGGVHAALLAAERDQVARLRETVLSVGVGICAVGPGANVQIEYPHHVEATGASFPQHRDVFRELQVLEKRAVRRRFTSLEFDNPLDYAASVFAIRPGNPQTKQDVATLLLERWGFGGPQTDAWWNCLYGGLFLGLVRESDGDESLQLTELGELTRNGLLSRYSAAELKKMTRQEAPLVDLEPAMAFLMRSLYLNEPDAGLVMRLLAGLRDPNVTLVDLLSRTVERYPNAALHLFIRSESRNDFAEAWREGRLPHLLKSDELGEMVHPSFYGPFKKQLVHLGVLHPKSAMWAKDEPYEPRRDIWIRRT